MDPNRWQRVKALLDKAFDLDPEERVEFLQKECGEDEKLRRQVESLLAADDQAGEIFEPANFKLDESKHEKDQKVGPYRILQVLGEGGMGVVYEAEQEHPVRRKVALKLIKLGMDTKAVVARFESERQALALMSHPSIASVYDAGATAEGRPYFVMEYVDGIPITNYCDKHRLSVKERLELFTQVCDGVQHAHLKGIIHRDIKPSNVLVTIRGDKPLPKIIDFGVAKATSQRLTEKTVFTELGLLIGTPEYMSPEQAEMTDLDVDTRTDVYALGVLLYELLVGAQPYDPEELRKAGLSEIIRKICEDDPPTPSTRLKSLGEASTTAARNRRVELPNLMRQLRGDLDWITLKAMEKDRTRRYSTANDLAADVGRYLKHEPVIARPASTSYRMSKFVRRHKVGVAASALVILALVAGGAAATIGFVRASRAEQQARQEAETATRVSNFLVELFEVSDPGEARGNTVTAREVLDRGAEKIGQELQNQPLIQARLLDTMGMVYRNLGLFKEAASAYTKALEARQILPGDENVEVSTSFFNLGILQRRMGNYDEAERLCRRALSIREDALGLDDPLVAQSMSGLATVVAQRGQLDKAERLFKRSLEIKEQQLGEDDPTTQNTVNDCAILYAMQGELEKSEPLFRRALATGERTLGSEHPMVGLRLENLGFLYIELGRYSEAEPLLVRGLEVLKKVHGEEHPDVANAMHNLALLYTAQSKYAQAESYYQRALTISEELLGSNHPQVVETLEDYADFLRKAGRDEEAAEMEQKAAAARAENS